jgi:periplasmic divalent cation tolerance protein
MAEERLIVFCTFPNAEEARRIIVELVELRLIACGNIFRPVESIYRWQGSIQSETEAFALLKTTASAFERLAAEYKSRHPYEIPELVAWPITYALPDYLAWISENVSVAQTLEPEPGS